MDKKIKLILIDFDDCLCQTEALCFALENQVVVQLGLPPMTRARHIANWGQPLAKAIAERVPGINVEMFMTLFNSHLEQAVLDGEFDHVTDSTLALLQKFKSEKRKLIIFTSRTKSEVGHLMAPAHPLSKLIDGWYYQEACIKETGVSKPDPAVIPPILKKFGVKPGQAVYIGDSLSDAMCAEGAGVMFVATLESGLRMKTDFSGYKVKKFIANFSELAEVVNTYESKLRHGV